VYDVLVLLYWNYRTSLAIVLREMYENTIVCDPVSFWWITNDNRASVRYFFSDGLLFRARTRNSSRCSETYERSNEQVCRTWRRKRVKGIELQDILRRRILFILTDVHVNANQSVTPGGFRWRRGTLGWYQIFARHTWQTATRITIVARSSHVRYF